MAQPDTPTADYGLQVHDSVSYSCKAEKTALNNEISTLLTRYHGGLENQQKFLRGMLICMNDLYDNTPKETVDYYLNLLEEHKGEIVSLSWVDNYLVINGGSYTINNKKIEEKLKSISTTQHNTIQHNTIEQNFVPSGEKISFFNTHEEAISAEEEEFQRIALEYGINISDYFPIPKEEVEDLVMYIGIKNNVDFNISVLQKFQANWSTIQKFFKEDKDRFTNVKQQIGRIANDLEGKEQVALTLIDILTQKPEKYEEALSIYLLSNIEEGLEKLLNFKNAFTAINFL